ncbi:hypothetical protein NGRA_1250 [Nosema granulosis]|uniref:Uncharacterized protein n=1 Tax=Nosema granulosis TaxID=83296 RepID=A0A9P6GZT7_9MICR|nr:hypothetical protein NGRA_1250 [Nosema granulosis]
MIKISYLFFFLLIKADDDYVLSAHSNKYSVYVHEKNIPSQRPYYEKVLRQVVPLENGYVFKLVVNLPKEKLINYKIDKNKVKIVHNDTNEINIKNKSKYENMEIMIEVRGGLISEIVIKSIFRNTKHQSEIFVLCSDSLPPHHQTYTVNKLYD